MERLIAQLKQRQVFKVATIYAVTAWPLIQIADLSVPALGLPDEVMTLLLQIFIAGFPVCLIFAWLFNVTSKGIVRVTADGETQSEPQANLQTTIAVSGSLALVLLVTLGSQLLMEDQAATAIAATQTDATSVVNVPVQVQNDSSKESIAVLPFVPFSNDKEDEFFADGMVEELLNLLARIPELQVSARTSSFAYKGVTNKTIPQIGRELGVNTILEGSIRKNDITNKIRVTAQLIKVSTGEHLWSETYDREYLDIFQIQDDIASAVVKKMELTLLGGEEKPVFVAQTNSVDAMVAFGKGQEELSHRTAASLNKALAYFKQAIKLDPNYARAHVGIADANNLLPLYGNVSMEVSQANAREAIDNALAIDSQLGEAYAAEGLLLGYSDREKAEQSYKQAIALNPSYGMAYMWYSTFLKKSGKEVEAQKMLEKAFELDPKSPVAAFNIAWQHYESGNEDKAMEMFSYMIANDPYYPGAYVMVGFILTKRGRLDQAITMFNRALAVDQTNKEAVKGLMMATMDMGNMDGVWHWFEYAEQREGFFDEGYMNLMKARYYLIKGDKPQALAYLDKTEFEHDMKGMNDMTEAEKHYIAGNYTAAITAYERYKTQDKSGYFYYMSDGDAPAHMAYAYQQVGDTAKAAEVIKGLAEYLEKNKKSKNTHADYYYHMAMLKALQQKKDEAFYYMQGAIDTGWVQSWKAQLDPVFSSVSDDPQFAQMMGGVEARLATMRTSLEADDEFLLADSDLL